MPFPSPGDLLNPRIEQLMHWQADSLALSHLGHLLINQMGGILSKHMYQTITMYTLKILQFYLLTTFQ